MSPAKLLKELKAIDAKIKLHEDALLELRGKKAMALKLHPKAA